MIYITVCVIHSCFTLRLQFRPSRPERSDQKRRIGTRMWKIGEVAAQILPLCVGNLL